MEVFETTFRQFGLTMKVSVGGNSTEAWLCEANDQMDHPSGVSGIVVLQSSCCCLLIFQ